MELVLVRHGEPERDAVDPANPGLSELGRRQAESVASYLATEHFDAVWSSPLRRATETAALVAAAHDLPVTTDADLAEFDRDAPAYIHFEDLIASRDPRYDAFLREDLTAWNTDLPSFRARVLASMARIVAAHPGGRVAVVSHGGVHNAYLGDVLALAKFTFHRPSYTSVSRVLVSSRGDRSIVSINETGHLRLGFPEFSPTAYFPAGLR